MSVKFKIYNYCYDDYGEFPEFTIIKITRDNFNRLKEIAKVVEDNKLEGAIGNSFLFDSGPSFYDNDDDFEKDEESPSVSDNAKILITSCDFRIEVIDCPFPFFSAWVGFTELENFLNVSELPIEHMPKYINAKDENVKNLAIERLRGG